jgi:hypothetical protein
MMPTERAGVTPPVPGAAAHRIGPGRLVLTWLLVVAASGVALRVADAVPRAALDIPRGVSRAADVEGLERASGRRMPVPAYFPDTLAWPPADARLHSSGSAAIWCRQRDGGETALIVATAPRGAQGVADAVLPPSVELQRETAVIGERALVVSRVRDADGAVWQQVQWQSPAQIVLVRYRGTLDELLKIAGSVND